MLQVLRSQNSVFLGLLTPTMRIVLGLRVHLSQQPHSLATAKRPEQETTMADLEAGE